MLTFATGGKKAEHLVTADDVDSYLAVEVIPIGKEEQMVWKFSLFFCCFLYVNLFQFFLIILYFYVIFVFLKCRVIS